MGMMLPSPAKLGDVKRAYFRGAFMLMAYAIICAGQTSIIVEYSVRAAMIALCVFIALISIAFLINSRLASIVLAFIIAILICVQSTYVLSMTIVRAVKHELDSKWQIFFLVVEWLFAAWFTVLGFVTWFKLRELRQKPA